MDRNIRRDPSHVCKEGAAQQQWQSVPLPEGFQPSAGTDKKAIVYRPSTGRYWEFWAMERSGRKVVNSASRRVDEWRADRGGKINDLEYWHVMREPSIDTLSSASTEEFV